MSLVAVEFDSDGRACRLIRTFGPQPEMLDILATGHRLDESDVNWCKRDQTYYVHETGSWTGRIYLSKLCGDGARHRLWVREFMTFSENGKGDEMISAARVAELGYDLDYSPEKPCWAPGGWSESRCYYCERCDEMYEIMRRHSDAGACDTEPECALVDELEKVFGLDTYSLQR